VEVFSEEPACREGEGSGTAKPGTDPEMK